VSNWYARYYGDYARDTGHLTLAQHGAYTVLLDTYYATRRPLPDDEEAIMRICRAFTPDEQSAVRSVLGQFFSKNGNGYHNKRADAELAKEAAISIARAKAGASGAYGKWHGKKKANATTSTTTSTEEPPPPPPHADSERERAAFDCSTLAGCVQAVLHARDGRPDAARYHPQADGVDRELARVPNGKRGAMVREYCDSVASMAEPPGDPIAKLRAYVRRAMDPEGSQRKDSPWELERRIDAAKAELEKMPETGSRTPEQKARAAELVGRVKGWRRELAGG
jgi:uncharacterized protein YdaU (DUF1376 family)